MISNAVQAGNIKLVSIKGHDVELDVELRDTASDWFYWCFEAGFPEPGLYHFHFTRPEKIGPHGPAVSLDGGATWQWLWQDYRTESQAFDYEFDGSRKRILFCMGMQYLQRDLKRFLNEFAENRNLRAETLCKSRKGRDVELITLKEGAPKYTLLLTSRHHAGEMMATHALEGILRAALAETPDGREFRKNIAVYAVPFVDKDGVEDGDQGKNRIPHDHARDYQESGIYPETAAIRKLIGEVKPDFVFDMHCPWIRGGKANEESYMVGTGIPKLDKAQELFADILERETTSEAPYFKSSNIPFGTSWNIAQNYSQGLTVKHYAANLDFVANSQTIEIPFANFGDVMIDRNSMLVYGAAIARSILRYLKENEIFQNSSTE